MNTLGERLKEERILLNMTQTEMGTVAGVGKTTQINYEKNNRSPDSDYLTAVAKIGVDVLYVLTGQRQSGSVVRPKQTFSKEKQFLMDAYDEMTDEQRRAVVEVSKVFAQPKPNKTAG